MQAKIIVKMVEQCMSNHNVVKFWSLGLDKITPWVARVSKIIVRVGSGWPKRPQVGLNFRSVLGPSHPYKTILILLRTLFSDSEQALYKKVWKMGKKI